MQINEANRVELIRKEQKSDNYANSKSNRYGQTFSISNYALFKKIDLNYLFTTGHLWVYLEVNGKTDKYTCVIKFKNFLKNLAIKLQDENLTYNTILFALRVSLDKEDLFLHCNCPDYIYRQNFWANKNKYWAKTEKRPSGKTNPLDTKGSMCKHLSWLLTDTSWLGELSKFLFNYLKTLKQKNEKGYETIINTVKKFKK